MKVSDILPNETKWIRPNLNDEYSEVVYQLKSDAKEPFLPEWVRDHMNNLKPKRRFIEYAIHHGIIINITPAEQLEIGNTGDSWEDSNWKADSKIRVEQLFKTNQPIEMPIILLNTSTHEKWLLGGHHRLTYNCQKRNKPTPCFVLKYQQLKEVADTSDLEEHGIDFSQYGERTPAFFANSEQVFVRESKTHKKHYVYDISDQAFIACNEVTGFNGIQTTKCFQISRMWTNPEVRGKGLCPTLLLGLYMQNCALMCDNLMSPSGKRSWLRFVNTIKPHQCYEYNTKTFKLEVIDKKQMMNSVLVDSDENVLFIIEQNQHPLLDIPYNGSIKKYLFERCN